MMKVLTALIVLLTVSTALAEDVTITCAQVGTTNEVTVSYAADTAAHKPRSIALDISIDTGTITNITKLVDNRYWVYPGTIDCNDQNQPSYSGTPVAVDGEGYSSMTIEMASLHKPTAYDDSNAPPQSGNIIKFNVSGDCNVTITGNATRNNIVRYDVTEASVIYSGCSIVIPPPECLKPTAPEYADWVANGRPDCWCFKRQCRGDADGAQLGPFWVSANDLTILRGAISKVVLPPGGICADFDHAASGPFRVSANDLTILRTYLSKSTVPCCDLDQDCTLTAADKYNFWTN